MRRPWFTTAVAALSLLAAVAVAPPSAAGTPSAVLQATSAQTNSAVASSSSTCTGWNSLPDSGQTTLKYTGPVSGTKLDEYLLVSKVRWNDQAQLDCFAKPGGKIQWAFEMSNRYKDGKSAKLKGYTANYGADVEEASVPYIDTNTLDWGNDTGFSYGILRPSNLRAPQTYTIQYTVRLPQSTAAGFRFSATGQIVEKNCSLANTWCVGGIGNPLPWGKSGPFDTVAEDGFIGFGKDSSPRLWTTRGSTCWQWKKNADPDYAPWPCASNAGGTGGGGSVPTPVVNKLPVAKFSYSRINGVPGKVFLNGSASTDADGTIAKYEWIAGGKVVATGSTASTVLTPGSTQSVTLRVTDNANGVGTASQSIALVNRAPSFAGTSPENGHVAGSNQPVLGATATDPDGDKLTYTYRITGDRVDVSSGATGTQWTVPSSRLDPGARYRWSATVSDGTTSVSTERDISVAVLPVAEDVVSTASGKGYWQVASDGGVFTHGDAQFYGSVPGLGLRLTNIMGMARTPSGNGYWEVGSDGGVFSFGDAAFYGSLPQQGKAVNNIVGMVPTKSGKGYWLVGSDGGVFTFGDAPFFGSMGGQPLQKPVTGMAATASGNGYWLVARDGGIFTFGDAPFYGSMGGQPLSYPVVDMDLTPDGGGYWLTAEDGGVFTFGNAQFYGSMAGKFLAGHINGMAATPSGKGYWLNGCDGGIFTFGDAPFDGASSTYQCRGIFYQ